MILNTEIIYYITNYLSKINADKTFLFVFDIENPAIFKVR